MSRYLGQKYFNWPAAILIFGWMALSAPIFFFPNSLSLFPRVLETEPLAWWPNMDFIGFALVMSPMLLGGLAIWLMPQVDWSARVGAVLVGLGASLFLAGIAWGLDSGTAVYRDRIVHRQPGILRSLQVERFDDIQRVEVSCSQTRRRRSSEWRPSPVYDLIFASGYRVDIWVRSASAGDWNHERRLQLVRIVSNAAEAAGAVRAPRRWEDGSLIGDAGCIQMLAERAGVDLGTVRGLFSVHQSELRPQEYVVRPD